MGLATFSSHVFYNFYLFYTFYLFFILLNWQNLLDMTSSTLCMEVLFFFFFLTFVLNSLRFQEIPLLWNFKLSVHNSLFIVSPAFIILTLYWKNHPISIDIL